MNRHLTVLLLVGGCGGMEPMRAEQAPMDERWANADAGGERFASPAAASAPLEVQYEMKEEADGGVIGGVARGRGVDAPPPPPGAPEPEPEAAAPERTRSWFPEAFLWRPEVVTGADGTALVELTVPDQLTTWRVLGLAHDTSGHQAGTVHTFDGTLPLYVDPVVPGWLYAGDRLVLPVQAVNTTSASVTASLEVDAEGALVGLGRAQVVLGAAGSDVRTIPLDAVGAGEARITARLVAGASNDAAERVIPVMPAGRPVERIRGGTLSSARTFQLPPPPAADGTTEELEVLVFPGPLAVLQLELERLQAGARPEDGAYGFAIDASIAQLSATAGVEVDEGAMRRLRILAWQRVVRDARAPDAGLAADLLLSIQDETRHAQVQELVPRLVRVVVDGQRADGTWSRRSSSTLQAVLVETAVAAYALPESEPGAKLRASAAIERYIQEVEDPWTAAVIVSSGLAREGLEDGLRKQVREGLTTDAESGEPRVVIPPDVVDAWGLRPSRAEMLAWTVLALPKDAPERGDLAAQLMQGWSASYGFGAGRGDAVALRAIVAAFGGVTGPVDVTLHLDDVLAGSGKLDPTQPRVPVTLSGKPAGQDPKITLTTSPAVPGLAFVAIRRSWVPWTDADRIPGVEVEVASGPLRVGEEGRLTLTAAGPSGAALRIEQGLPSGADVGEDARARAEAVGATLEVLTDRVVIVTRPFQAGEVFTLELPVTPAFAGRFQTGPLQVSVDGGAPVPMRPVVWQVAGVGGGS